VAPPRRTTYLWPNQTASLNDVEGTKMSNKLFVGGLSWDTQSEGLREAFDQFGTVTDAAVITDRHTGRSRGFGFVTYATAEGATKAREEMDGTTLDGRTVNVDVARSRQSSGGSGRW